LGSSRLPSGGTSDGIPFDPLDFLRLADALMRSGDDEARSRSAISRVYYGLFLVARDRMGITDHRGVHEIVIAELALHGHSGLAGKLGQIRRLREVADYQRIPVDPLDRDWAKNWRYTRGVGIRALAEMADRRWIPRDAALALLR
jgi:hypothetical protein